MALLSRKLLVRRPQELGKIKIGRLGIEKTSSGGKKFRMPEKLDHFIVTTRHRGDDENFVIDEQIHSHESVGLQPTELAGVLMYETPEENFHAEMVQYSGRSKIWSCDGEEAENLKTGACGACPRLKGGECKCKPYARLHLQLWASPYTMGYHVFRTTSWETANNIQTALEEIYERFGTCYNAPVKLVLYPAEDSYVEGGKEKTSQSWKVGLVLAMSMEAAMVQMVETKRRMELAKNELKMLAAGVQQDLAQRDEEEAAAIASEFFPDPTAVPSIQTQETLESLKKDLGIGQQNGAPVIEGDFEVEEPGAAASAEEIGRLKDLRDRAFRHTDLLVPEDDEAIKEVVAAQDGPGVRMWILVLEERLGKAGPAQASLLEA